MKVKSMKKALSLFCAGAMIATSFAVVNFDTVKAATADSPNWQWNSTYSENGYLKVPYTELTAAADSYSPGECTGGAGPERLIDGQLNTYYHSNWENLNNQGPVHDNGNDGSRRLTARNTITISFKENGKKSVSGFTYVPRQDAFGNGAFMQFKVQVGTDGNAITADTPYETFSTATANTDQTVAKITYFNNNGTDCGSDAPWANNTELGKKNKKEREVLFATPKDNVTSMKITVEVTGGQFEGNRSKHINGAEISVLSKDKMNAEGHYEVSNFVTFDGKRITPPTPVGKVFAGWYTDNTYKTPFVEKSGMAYAKFVDEKTLSACFQALANTDSYSTSTKLRFVSTVDSLKYQETGFYLKRSDRTKEVKIPNTTVYENLYAVGENGGDVAISKEVMKSTFSADSEYFVANTMTINPLSEKRDLKYDCTPYWITMDGTVVRGQKRSMSVSEAIGAAYRTDIKYTKDPDSGAITEFKPTDNPNWILPIRGETTGLSASSRWENYPTGSTNDFGEFLLGKKFEVDNATASDTAEYVFSGKHGIAVYSQKNTGYGQYKVKVVDTTTNQNVGEEKTVSLVNAGGRLDKVLVYSNLGLDAAKQYKLVITGVSGKVCVDAFYLIP